MKVSVLIVTFRKDIDFACYSFASLKKFATGFHELVVVVPTPDVELFTAAAEVCAPVFAQGVRVVGFDERPGKGMLHHMVKILAADELCPDADAILHLDADCLFTSPVTPADYLENGKPVIFRQRYENFRQCDSRYSWKACVRNATGIDPEWETMVRHPNTYLRSIYPLVRDIIGNHVQQDWAEYILSCRNVYPQTFAEFPTIGAVAIQCDPNAYHWIDCNRLPDGSWSITPADREQKLLAFWGHGGLEMVNDRHPTMTARQKIAEILA